MHGHFSGLMAHSLALSARQNEQNQSHPIHPKLIPWNIIAFNLILTASKCENSDSTLREIRPKVRVRVRSVQCQGTSHSHNTESSHCSISVFHTHSQATQSHHSHLQLHPAPTSTAITPTHPLHRQLIPLPATVNKACIIYQQCIRTSESPVHFDFHHRHSSISASTPSPPAKVSKIMVPQSLPKLDTFETCLVSCYEYK